MRRKRSIGAEIGAVFVLLLGAAIFLSLVSFNPADLHGTGPSTNFFGPVGAHLGDILLHLFGLGAFFFAGVVVMLGALLLFGKRIEMKPSEFVGQGLLILGGSVLFHLLFHEQKLLGHMPGGAVGALVGEMGRTAFNDIGTYVLCFSSLLLGIILVTDTSFHTFFRAIRGAAQGAWRFVRTRVQRLRSGPSPGDSLLDADELSDLSLVSAVDETSPVRTGRRRGSARKPPSDASAAALPSDSALSEAPTQALERKAPRARRKKKAPTHHTRLDRPANSRRAALSEPIATLEPPPGRPEEPSAPEPSEHPTDPDVNTSGAESPVTDDRARRKVADILARISTRRKKRPSRSEAPVASNLPAVEPDYDINSIAPPEVIADSRVLADWEPSPLKNPPRSEARPEPVAPAHRPATTHQPRGARELREVAALLRKAQPTAPEARRKPAPPKAPLVHTPESLLTTTREMASGRELSKMAALLRRAQPTPQPQPQLRGKPRIPIPEDAPQPRLRRNPEPSTPRREPPPPREAQRDSTSAERPSRKDVARSESGKDKPEAGLRLVPRPAEPRPNPLATPPREPSARLPSDNAHRTAPAPREEARDDKPRPEPRAPRGGADAVTRSPGTSRGLQKPARKPAPTARPDVEPEVVKAPAPVEEEPVAEEPVEPAATAKAPAPVAKEAVTRPPEVEAKAAAPAPVVEPAAKAATPTPVEAEEAPERDADDVTADEIAEAFDDLDADDDDDEDDDVEVDEEMLIPNEVDAFFDDDEDEEDEDEDDALLEAASEAEEVAPSIVVSQSRQKRVGSEDLDAVDQKKKLVKKPTTPFERPPLSLLSYDPDAQVGYDTEQLQRMARLLEEKLADFRVKGKVTQICPGPVVTRFEFLPAPGTKVATIANLADDIAMGLEAMSVRVIAPIPGKGVVGVEVPNEQREIVFAKEIFAADAFQEARSILTLALGKDIEGEPIVANLAKMPHLLVAGATGSGKSVAINTMICSLLYNATPEQVKLLLVDPKRLELSIYKGIPHLLLPPITEPKKASAALKWAVEEMEHRYTLMAETGVRSLKAYNNRVGKLHTRLEKINPDSREAADIHTRLGVDEDGEARHEVLPYIVIVIDELADLMMVAAKEIETHIARLAQMARACGIHLILATQRPSVDVLTGLIKANFPTRISFRVFSRHDSKVVLDQGGAEALLGMGDMLFLPPGTAQLKRVHGAFLSDEEVQGIADYLKEQGSPQYCEDILKSPSEGDASVDEEHPVDELYDKAVALVAKMGVASISKLQRKLRVGYNRAARMVEAMEEEGIVGPQEGSKPRDVLIDPI